MKKLFAILLAAAMLLSLAACASPADAGPTTDAPSTDAPSTEAPSTEAPSTDAGTEDVANGDNAPLTLLTTVWEAIPEADRFAAVGGDFSEEHMKENAPGVYTLDDAQELDRMLGYPAAQADKLEAAASLTHMLNVNTFTAAAYQVKDGEDMDALAQALVLNIQSRQWVCGFPDRLLVAYVDNCLIGAFGAGDLLDTFQAQLTACYANVVIVSEAPIE